MAYPETWQVLAGVQFGDSNEFTGTLVLPEVWDVKDGVLYGQNGTDAIGNMNQPTAGVVLTPIQYGSNGTELSGALVLPSGANVTNPVQYGVNGTESTGSYVVAAVADVKLGVAFGANSSETGTYNPGSAVYPTPAEVLTGVPFGDGGEQTGTYQGPDPNKYLTSGTYGANGSASGNYVAPSGSAVLNNESYGVGLNGFYFAPSTAQVQQGVTFGDNNTLTGTLASSAGGGKNIMQGQLLGSVAVTGPANVSLGNVSGLSDFGGSLIIGSSENGTSRFAIGATAANASYGNPIGDGQSTEINAGPNAGASTSITLSVPTGAKLWLLSYKQPRIANEF